MASLEVLEVLDTKPVKYRIICHDCKSDPELNGDATYFMLKDKYEKGQLPCGCSKSPKRTEEQYEVLIARACKASDFTFHGWFGEFCGRNSWIVVECPRHGVLPHKSLNDFLGGRRCIECRRDNVKTALTKPDAELIQRFRGAGCHHPDTTFKRSPRVTQRQGYRDGVRCHWVVTCGECHETHEIGSAGLGNGQKPCSCSIAKQRYAYIHQVLTEDGLVVALKFGITSHPKKRLSQQDLASSLTVVQKGLWLFEEYKDCRAAESEVKKSVNCKLLAKNDMPDGWTETCDESEEGNIVMIYEKFNGRRVA